MTKEQIHNPIKKQTFSSAAFECLALDLNASKKNSDTYSNKSYSAAELSQISDRIKAIGIACGLLEDKQDSNNLLEMEYRNTAGPIGMVPCLIAFDERWKEMILNIQWPEGQSTIISGIKNEKTNERNGKAFLVLNLPNGKEHINWYIEYGIGYSVTATRSIRAENNTVIVTHSGGVASTEDELKEDSEERASRHLESALRIESKEASLQINQRQYFAKYEIAMLKTLNLAHQIWNSYSGALLAACYCLAKNAKQPFVFVFDEQTNYFPAEALAKYFSSGSKICAEDYYISPNYLFFCDSKAPLHLQIRNSTSSLARKAHEKIAIDNNIQKQNTVIIFSLKAGNKAYSETQFPIEDAITITSQTIKVLTKRSPVKFQFVIDGMMSPYIPEIQEQHGEEPEQRKGFRESEEYWFGKLREELPGIELTFINGMNLVEKYPYYQAASKFVRFGDGSYHYVWESIKNSDPENHIVVIKQNKYHGILRKQHERSYIKHTEDISKTNILLYNKLSNEKIPSSELNP